MSLTVGTRLGPYEITALLGVGGIGEVYRAHDTKLRRDVAIKVLPASFANDAERLTRFDREARILAALNHPHISGQTFEAGVPKQLFRKPNGLEDWGVTPDGEKFLFAAPTTQTTPAAFTVELNWQEGLRK
jgi:serine/threonine protein kinase